MTGITFAFAIKQAIGSPSAFIAQALIFRFMYSIAKLKQTYVPHLVRVKATRG